jgi:hypothetical protein
MQQGCCCCCLARQLELTYKQPQPEVHSAGKTGSAASVSLRASHCRQASVAGGSGLVAPAGQIELCMSVLSHCDGVTVTQRRCAVLLQHLLCLAGDVC